MCTDPFNLGSDLRRRATQFTEVKNRRCPPMGITNAIKVTRSMALIPIVTTPLETATDFTGVEFGVGRTARGRSETNRIATRNSNLGARFRFILLHNRIGPLQRPLYLAQTHTDNGAQAQTKPHYSKHNHPPTQINRVHPTFSVVRLAIPSVVGFPPGVGVSSVLTDLAAFSLA
jgi:hypothetical protein